MKLKRIAIRGLIALAVVVALCMFFANTIVTITTPKVRIVEASRGKLEQKISLSAQVFFPKTTDYTLTGAMKNIVVVDKVYVRAGQTVAAGETLFTAVMPDYEQAMKDLQDKYDAKAAELLDKDIANPRTDKGSSQNQLYQMVLDRQTALSQAEHDARVLATELNVTLGADSAQWERRAAGQDELLTAVQAALDAQKAYDTAYDAFFNDYRRSSEQFRETTFTYIKERDVLLSGMNDLLDEMVALTERKNALTTVTAPQAGYVVAMNVKNGDTYDGKTSAFTLSGEEAPPQLRADITSLGKVIADGTKVEVTGNNGTEKTSVENTALGGDGKKYLYISLTDDVISAKGGVAAMLTDGSVAVTVRYKAKQSATLLPAAVVRSEGENTDYVYVLNRDYSGFLGSSAMKVVKTSVTVLERGDTMVSVKEDLSYQEIAGGEDRPLSDGCTVMEYLD
jgi:multidrug efflux pump subunit AcrA (membrane-fusion protein)